MGPLHGPLGPLAQHLGMGPLHGPLGPLALKQIGIWAPWAPWDPWPFEKYDILKKPV